MGRQTMLLQISVGILGIVIGMYAVTAALPVYHHSRGPWFRPLNGRGMLVSSTAVCV